MYHELTLPVDREVIHLARRRAQQGVLFHPAVGEHNAIGDFIHPGGLYYIGVAIIQERST